MLTIRITPANQGSKPSGWFGRFNLWRMNSSHSKLTDWGLRHISIDTHDTILDVGCGGGRTVAKLADIAKLGKVYGIDHSGESVAASKKHVAQYITLGRVEILNGSVSQLPFSNNMFDLTAVETHFWWPNLPGDMREVFVGGTLIFIAELSNPRRRLVHRRARAWRVARYNPPPRCPAYYRARMTRGSEYRQIRAH
jgi:SAM-dependent methyltransferase